MIHELAYRRGFPNRNITNEILAHVFSSIINRNWYLFTTTVTGNQVSRKYVVTKGRDKFTCLLDRLI